VERSLPSCENRLNTWAKSIRYFEEARINGICRKEPRKREPKYSAIPVKAALERYSTELVVSYKNKEKLVKKVSTKLAKVVTSTPTQEVAYTLDSYQIANWAIRAVVS